MSTPIILKRKGASGNPVEIYPKTTWTQVADKPATFTPTAHTLTSHSDVTITSPSTGQVLKYNGTAWVNGTDNNTADTNNFLTSVFGGTGNSTVSFAREGLSTLSINLAHAHGNINTSGQITSATQTVATGDQLLIRDASNSSLISNGPSFGTSTTTFLANDGVFRTPADSTTLTGLGITSTAAELNVLDGITATTTELNYTDGVTSNIQTQLNGKAASSHTHGNITNAGAIGTTASLPIITTTSGVLTTGSFGTTAGTFAQGNDSRLSDARTPLSHTHGDISNAGAIATTAVAPESNDYIIISDSSASNVLKRGILINSAIPDGTFLANNGTFSHAQTTIGLANYDDFQQTITSTTTPTLSANSISLGADTGTFLIRAYFLTTSSVSGSGVRFGVASSSTSGISLKGGKLALFDTSVTQGSTGEDSQSIYTLPTSTSVFTAGASVLGISGSLSTPAYAICEMIVAKSTTNSISIRFLFGNEVSATLTIRNFSMFATKISNLLF